jgi:hypothetical protein
MYSAIYKVKMVGATPLLMHRDNISFGEQVKLWQKNPGNKKMSVAGDDRSPAWAWIGYLYDDGECVTMDSDNLMAMLRDAGKKCPAATGRGSIKSATQSGIVVNEIGWRIVGEKGEIPMEPINAMIENNDFMAHRALAEKLGFDLFVKRARVGTSKHVRVRPRFMKWACSGTITVLDETLTDGVLQNLFLVAGRFVGCGDWRPASISSGRYGCFSATISRD